MPANFISGGWNFLTPILGVNLSDFFLQFGHSLTLNGNRSIIECREFVLYSRINEVWSGLLADNVSLKSFEKIGEAELFYKLRFSFEERASVSNCLTLFVL